MSASPRGDRRLKIILENNFKFPWSAFYLQSFPCPSHTRTPQWLFAVVNLFERKLFSFRYSSFLRCLDDLGTQSYATLGSNYLILNLHTGCFIIIPHFQSWTHIHFLRQLCRGNNSLKLTLFLSYGTGRKSGQAVGSSRLQEKWAGSTPHCPVYHGPANAVDLSTVMEQLILPF